MSNSGNKTGEVFVVNYDSGAIQYETTDAYDGGCKSGTVKEFYENGQLKSVMPYLDFMPHGLYQQWDSTGKLLGQCTFVHGTGILRRWHENGQLESQLELVDNILRGKMILYDSSGKIMGKQSFSNPKESGKRKRAKTSTSSPDKIDKNEQFCIDRKKGTARLDAKCSINGKPALLGENTENESNKIMLELIKKGAEGIFAGDLEEDSRVVGVGFLVVNLPVEKNMRKSLIAYIDRLGERLGYHGEGDYGQRSMFLKLD